MSVPKILSLIISHTTITVINSALLGLFIHCISYIADFKFVINVETCVSIVISYIVFLFLIAGTQAHIETSSTKDDCGCNEKK